jgi:hypothetical protein
MSSYYLRGMLILHFNILVIYICGFFAYLGELPHFCLGITVCEFCIWFCLGFGGFHVRIGKE